MPALPLGTIWRKGAGNAMTQERKPKIPKSRLRKSERAMIDAVLRGEEIDLAQFAPRGQKKAQIRADILRDLILGRYGPVHERGVRLLNAHISGQLDLSHCKIFSLRLYHSIFGSKNE